MSKYIPVHGFGDDDGLETTMTTMMMVWFGLVVHCKKLGKCNLIHFFPTIEQHSGTVTFFVVSIIFIRSYENDNRTKSCFNVIFDILCIKHCGKLNWLCIFFTSQNRPLSESLPSVDRVPIWLKKKSLHFHQQVGWGTRLSLWNIFTLQQQRAHNEAVTSPITAPQT